MRPEDMPVAEVKLGIGFCDAGLLDYHVQKHVIEDYDQRWEQLLDPVALSKAREEWRANRSRGDSWEKVSRQYQLIVLKSIVDACQAGRWHQHEADFSGHGATKAAISQIVEAWPPDHLRVKARVFVRGNELKSYELWTALRRWVDLTDQEFETQCVAWVRDRGRLGGRCIVRGGKHY